VGHCKQPWVTGVSAKIGLGRPSDRSACAVTVSHVVGANVESPRTGPREKHCLRLLLPTLRTNSSAAL